MAAQRPVAAVLKRAASCVWLPEPSRLNPRRAPLLGAKRASSQPRGAAANAVLPPSDGSGAGSFNGFRPARQQSADSGSVAAGAGPNGTGSDQSSGLHRNLRTDQARSPLPQPERAQQEEMPWHVQSSSTESGTPTWSPAASSQGASHLAAPQIKGAAERQSTASTSVSNSAASLQPPAPAGWLGAGATRAGAPADSRASDGTRQPQVGDVQPWGCGTSERLSSLGEQTRRRHEDAASGAASTPGTRGCCRMMYYFDSCANCLE